MKTIKAQEKKTKEKPENKDTEKKIHFNWQ